MSSEDNDDRDLSGSIVNEGSRHGELLVSFPTPSGPAAGPSPTFLWVKKRLANEMPRKTHAGWQGSYCESHSYQSLNSTHTHTPHTACYKLPHFPLSASDLEASYSSMRELNPSDSRGEKHRGSWCEHSKSCLALQSVSNGEHVST